MVPGKGKTIIAALALAALPIAAPLMAQNCAPGTVFGGSQDLDAGTYSAYLAEGDFNEDGIADLVVTNYGAHTVTVHPGLGGGAFGPKRTLLPGSGPRNPVLADFTGDGITDLAVSCFDANSIVVMPGLGASGVGNGEFGPPAGSASVTAPRGFAVADFNADGILDLAATNPNSIVILLGQGTGGVWNGGFATVGSYSQVAPWDVVAGDWNADGILDLAASNVSNGGVGILRGTGNGQFQEPQSTVFATATDIVAHDFDLNGKLDLAVSGLRAMVLLNNSAAGGVPSFVPTSLGNTANQNGIAAGDFTGEGLIDLAVTTPEFNQLWLFRGTALGEFSTAAETYPLSSGAIGIVASDLNQDGVSDVAVACSGPGVIQYMLSRCGPPTAPVVIGVLPEGGRIGDQVAIFGSSFVDVTSVTFNGIPATYTVVSETEIRATVPAGATTGPISVTTPRGTGTSSFDFFVGETPLITSAAPLEGKVGTEVVITGLHFTGATRVSFGVSGSDAPFTVDSDQQITATVDGAAESGPISVTTPAATGTGSFNFTVIPFDTAARIVSVRDVPRDEGGRVTVKWVRSDFDRLQGFVTGYRLWRRAPLGTRTASAAIEYWEPVGEVPAARLDGYALIAATTEDSTEDANPYTAFFVQTLTGSANEFYNSAVDSGYSVDNRGPKKPPKLHATYTPRGALLSWGGNEERDLWGYRLFRGDTLGFVPDTSNLVYAGPDTSYNDTTGTGGYYLLTAEDRHGNRSRYALVTPREATVGVALMVAAEVAPREVRVRWYVIGQPHARVFLERRTAEGTWQRRADLVTDGAGMVSYRDHDVAAGQRLGYRLGMVEEDQEVFGGEVWVEVPEARLALLGIWPNPLVAGDQMRVRFVVPHEGRVTFRVLDIAGRTMLREELGRRAAGVHETPITWRRRPVAGIYLARLEHDGGAVSTKVGVIR